MSQPHPETRYRLLQWTNGSAKAERLAAQILQASGYRDLDPALPLGGPDGGMDARCSKNGEAWIMAVYFPRGEMDFASIKRKFLHDLAGVQKNAAQGIAFVTNQALHAAQIAALVADYPEQPFEIFALERIASLLDQANMAGVRQQFLAIEDDGCGRPLGWLLQPNWLGLTQGYLKGQSLIINQAQYALPVTLQPFHSTSPDIAARLSWRSRTPQQLYGRDADMANLHTWAKADHAGRNLRLRVLQGAGGSGKSRLAVEFALQLQEEGWQACHLLEPSQALALAQSATGTLLLIEDAELHVPAIKNLFKTLKHQNFGARLRILLLARHSTSLEKWLQDYLPACHSPILHLGPLADITAVQAMLAAIWQDSTAAQHLHHAPHFTKLQAWLAQDEQHALPQMVLALGLQVLANAKDSADALDWHLPHIAPHWVNLERARLRREVKMVADMQVQGTEMLLVLAALLASIGQLDAAALPTLRAWGAPLGLILPSVNQLKQTAYWSLQTVPQQVATPAWPDWLAAQMLHTVLAERLVEPTLIGAWLWQGLQLGAPPSAPSVSSPLLAQRLQRLATLCSYLDAQGAHRLQFAVQIGREQQEPSQ